MDDKAIVREAMKVRGINQQMLAKQAGLKYQSNVGGMLRSEHMRVDNFFKLLNAMGFDIIVKDRNGQNRENVWKVEIE